MTPSLIGRRIAFRAMEPSDIDLLYNWINSPEEVPSASLTQPLSRRSLELYIQESHQSIFEINVQRFVIYRHVDYLPIGTIELYDFDPYHKRAAIGIFVSPEHRRKGYASEAVEIICKYAFEDLHLRQVYAEMADLNTSSKYTFEASGFSLIATLPHWLWYQGDYHTLLVYVRYC